MLLQLSPAQPLARGDDDCSRSSQHGGARPVAAPRPYAQLHAGFACTWSTDTALRFVRRSINSSSTCTCTRTACAVSRSTLPTRMSSHRPGRAVPVTKARRRGPRPLRACHWYSFMQQGFSPARANVIINVAIAIESTSRSCDRFRVVLQTKACVLWGE